MIGCHGLSAPYEMRPIDVPRRLLSAIDNPSLFSDPRASHNQNALGDAWKHAEQ